MYSTCRGYELFQWREKVEYNSSVPFTGRLRDGKMRRTATWWPQLQAGRQEGRQGRSPANEARPKERG